VRSEEALATVTCSALLGTLARTRRHARPTAASDGSTQLSESYRRLSVRLTAAGDPGRKLSFLVTSAIPDEGKNRVALGLARAFAERGRRVLLVDADIRQPTIAGIAGLEDTGGLTGMLDGTMDAAAAVQKWGPTGLDVLVAGPAASRPADLMASPAMADAIGRFRKRYDVLVIGTAPINPVADAVVLGSLVDGVVVVVDSTRVLRSQLTEAIDSLQDSNIPVLGVVLDRAPRRRGTGTYHVARTSSGSKDSFWRTLRGRLDVRARRSLPATELTGDTDKAPDERND
jgi:capsular exopolysaccharide synthesis family protein